MDINTGTWKGVPIGQAKLYTARFNKKENIEQNFQNHKLSKKTVPSIKDIFSDTPHLKNAQEELKERLKNCSVDKALEELGKIRQMQIKLKKRHPVNRPSIINFFPQE